MCRKAFMMFDKNGNGTIDVQELKLALKALGQDPTDEELFVMISQVDEDGSKEIEFVEFVRAIQINKAMSEKSSAEADTIDAFVALGGNADKTGKVNVDKLQMILEDFELSLDISRFSGDGEERVDMGYEEFKAILA